MKKLFAILALTVLLVGCFSTLINAQLTTDTSIISMGGKDWSLKVDSNIQTVLDSKNQPYVSVQKSGTEKELFLQLNSLKDCASGQIEFKVETQGLTIYKQLALSAEEIKQGFLRPENVVNSFACYDDNGKKVLHIYASKLVDAKGNSVWVDSDLKDGLLIVYLNQTWLETAVFPVVVDPTFGYTDVGASQLWADYDLTISENFTVNDYSLLTGFSVYINGAWQTYQYGTGLYYSNGTKIIDSSITKFISDTARWENFVLEDYILLNESNYYLACAVKGNTGNFLSFYYDSSSLLTLKDNLFLPTQINDAVAHIGNDTDKLYSLYASFTDLTPTPTASPSATPTPTTTNNYIGIGALALFTLIAVYFITKPQSIINFVIGILSLGISVSLAAAGLLGGVWMLGLAGAIIGILCMIRGTDLL